MTEPLIAAHWKPRCGFLLCQVDERIQGCECCRCMGKADEEKGFRSARKVGRDERIIPSDYYLRPLVKRRVGAIPLNCYRLRLEVERQEIQIHEIAQDFGVRQELPVGQGEIVG